jgi:hypothetical protein
LVRSEEGGAKLVCSASDGLWFRSRHGLPRRPCALSRLAKAALALALVVPLSAPLAKTDCASLDIEFEASAEFTKVECDQGSFGGGGPSETEEVIGAQSSTSLFVIHHAEAGVRTYFERRDTRGLLEGEPLFAKTENWAVAPGGNQFIVTRFKGWLAGQPALPLSCFGFSRFTAHVARSTGYRHIVYGFYCALQPDQISDSDVRRLIGALKLSFE